MYDPKPQNNPLCRNCWKLEKKEHSLFTYWIPRATKTLAERPKRPKRTGQNPINRKEISSAQRREESRLRPLSWLSCPNSSCVIPLLVVAPPVPSGIPCDGHEKIKDCTKTPKTNETKPGSEKNGDMKKGEKRKREESGANVRREEVKASRREEGERPARKMVKIQC